MNRAHRRNRRCSRFVIASTIVAVATSLVGPPALAGPPLVCSRHDNGGAPSLPWGGENWRDVDAKYDRSRLVADTLRLLAPDTPVIARMETLRRATVYVKEDSGLARRLLAALEERVAGSAKAGKADPLALFDAGYLILSYDQASWYLRVGNWFHGRDGYELMVKAIGSSGGSPQMHFAAAIATTHGVAAEPGRFARHLEAAIAGAAEGSLLERNLLLRANHFPFDGGSEEGMRERIARAREAR